MENFSKSSNNLTKSYTFVLFPLTQPWYLQPAFKQRFSSAGAGTGQRLAAGRAGVVLRAQGTVRGWELTDLLAFKSTVKWAFSDQPLFTSVFLPFITVFLKYMCWNSDVYIMGMIYSRTSD